MDAYVNEIYSDFIKFFEPLEMQGNVTQSELDLAIKNFHCQSKLKMFNIFSPNIRKENFIDCANPLKLSKNTTSYIPYNHIKARELVYDSKPAVHRTNYDDVILIGKCVGGVIGVIGSWFLICWIYTLIIKRRR